MHGDEQALGELLQYVDLLDPAYSRYDTLPNGKEVQALAGNRAKPRHA